MAELDRDFPSYAARMGAIYGDRLDAAEIGRSYMRGAAIEAQIIAESPRQPGTTRVTIMVDGQGYQAHVEPSHLPEMVAAWAADMDAEGIAAEERVAYCKSCIVFLVTSNRHLDFYSWLVAAAVWLGWADDKARAEMARGASLFFHAHHDLATGMRHLKYGIED